jgi:uncharacterized membrane protein
MPPEGAIVAWWLAFAGTHIALSSRRLRPRLVAALGERGYLGVFSLVAFATFIPLVSTYFSHKHEGPFLWYGGTVTGLRWLMYAGMAFALALLAASFIQPSPASITGGKTEVAGVHRITRHPLLMALGIYGLLHLLVARVNATELAFFAGFPLFTIAGCLHQDQRKLASAGEPFARFHAATPFLPFSRGGWLRGLAEMPLALAIGVALAVLLRSFHGRLFG